MSTLRSTLATTTAAALLGLSGVAMAAPITIDYTDVVGGTLPAGTTATPVGGSFQVKSAGSGADSITGVGISGGPTPGEIDVGQSIVFDFGSAVVLNDLRIALLYVGPAWGDPTDGEKAEFVATLAGGGSSTVTFQVNADGTSGVLDPFTGSWNFCSTNAANLESSGGCWDFADLFGNNAITSLALNARSVVDSGNDTDYVFVNMTYTPVPAPAALALLGFGLVGIALVRRRISA